MGEHAPQYSPQHLESRSPWSAAKARLPVPTAGILYSWVFPRLTQENKQIGLEILTVNHSSYFP